MSRDRFRPDAAVRRVMPVVRSAPGVVVFGQSAGQVAELFAREDDLVARFCFRCDARRKGPICLECGGPTR
jgi:hypothetical protein